MDCLFPELKLRFRGIHLEWNESMQKKERNGISDWKKRWRVFHRIRTTFFYLNYDFYSIFFGTFFLERYCFS